jgi:hypothetical protein
MTTHVADPVQLIADGLDAEYAGPGMWGSIYRAPQRRRWYRIIPGDELDADRWSQLGELRNRPRRRDLVPILREGTDQRQFGGAWYQVVCYETEARQCLADQIVGPDPVGRIAAVATASRALPGWWEAGLTGFIPMPADIVLADDWPLCLPLPSWGPPSIGEIFAEPGRIAHLAPELIRGSGPAGRASDIFTFAVMALRCFTGLDDGDAETLLHRAACAALTSGPSSGSRLPFWMRRMKPIQAAYEKLLELTGPDAEPRAEADPLDVADLLDRTRDAMNPLTAVRLLREAGQPRQAVDLAHGVLLDGPSYDALILAARIAGHDLRAPLEALSLLERAVEADPDRAEAYLEQISIIADGRVGLLGGLADSFTQRVDGTIRTAFDKLPPQTRREQAHEMAGYLIGRDAVAEANTLVHQWLHDEAGTLMWWRLDLMLDYAETFLLLGHLGSARDLATAVKQALGRLRDNRQLPQLEIHENGMRLARLEVRIREAEDTA